MRAPLLIDPATVPLEQWDDPALRGAIRWRMLMSAPQTATEAFTCGIAYLEPGEHFVAHSHAEPEIYFGISGEVDVEIDGATYRLRPECALFIPGHAVHGIPRVKEAVRYFYAFAADGFGGIEYHFPGETA